MLKYLILFTVTATMAAEYQPVPTNLVKALIKVESGGNDKAVGDNSLAKGCLQIHPSYFKDAQDWSIKNGDCLKLKGKTWADLTNRTVSVNVVVAYFNRYGSNWLKTNNLENLARLHNGGANWQSKAWKTDKYWQKVKKELAILE